MSAWMQCPTTEASEPTLDYVQSCIRDVQEQSTFIKARNMDSRSTAQDNEMLNTRNTQQIGAWMQYPMTRASYQHALKSV